MFDTLIIDNINYISKFQIKTVEKLNDFFNNEDIYQFIDNSYIFKGVRGSFIDKINFCLSFSFVYKNYLFEFYIMYDQLEYYIIDNNNFVLKETNIEDFRDENTHINNFLKFFMRDLEELNIR